MITEDYVSRETAKLMKEKGFEGVVNAYYHIWDKHNIICSVQEFSHSEAPHLYFPAPTLQMAMKWLREVHKLYVSVIPSSLNYKHQDIQDGWACEVTHLSDLSYDSDYEFFQKKYQTYESACEAAIRYCLEKLI